MAKKPPLYPHVPKSKLGAFICGQCPLRFHSREELDKHLAQEHPEADASVARAEERRTYYCAIEEKHPHREIVQVSTTQKDPECPYCRGIMTYGTWWPVTQAEES